MKRLTWVLGEGRGRGERAGSILGGVCGGCGGLLREVLMKQNTFGMLFSSCMWNSCLLRNGILRGCIL